MWYTCAITPEGRTCKIPLHRITRNVLYKAGLLFYAIVPIYTVSNEKAAARW